MGCNINGFADAVTLNGNMNTAAGVKWTIATMDTTAAEQTLFTTCVAGENPIGVFVDDYAVNAVASVATSGIGRVTCSGNTNNIAVGDWIKATTAGVGILAAHGDPSVGIALEPCTAATTSIRVLIQPGAASYFPSSETDSAASVAITVADLRTGYHSVTCSKIDGAVALSIPAAASVRAGTTLRVLRTAHASAITITPASGNIAAAGTHSTLDAINDLAIFVADPVGTNWYIDHSIIA